MTERGAPSNKKLELNLKTYREKTAIFKEGSPKVPQCKRAEGDKDEVFKKRESDVDEDREVLQKPKRSALEFISFIKDYLAKIARKSHQQR